MCKDKIYSYSGGENSNKKDHINSLWSRVITSHTPYCNKHLF